MLLDCDNSFLKWGAIMTVANLTITERKSPGGPSDSFANTPAELQIDLRGSNERRFDR